MTYKELTTGQQRRLRNANRICHYCGDYIFDKDEIKFTTNKIGRLTVYHFYHGGCYESKIKKESQVQSKG